MALLQVAQSPRAGHEDQSNLIILITKEIVSTLTLCIESFRFKMSEFTTMEDIRKPESKVSKKNDGNVPAESEPSLMKVDFVSPAQPFIFC